MNSLWKTTLLLTKLFFLAFVTQPLFADSPRVQDGPKIDFMRQEESGISHLALRCSRGLAADTALKCQVRRSSGGEVILAAPMEEATIRKALQTFFAAIPAKEIKKKDGAVPKIERSPLHWKINDGDKFVMGGYQVTEPAPNEADAQDKYDRAIMVLELELDAALHRGVAALLQQQ